jgi:hypothetical protein
VGQIPAWADLVPAAFLPLFISKAFFFFQFLKQLLYFVIKLAQFELPQILQIFVKVLESIRLKGCRTKGI